MARSPFGYADDVEPSGADWPVRVLPPAPRRRRTEYEAGGGGAGLAAAERLGPDGVVEHLLAAGLRGRGGAGFPTGRKWDAVLRHESRVVPATVVVNAAEGEPGSFKDRVILRRNPHAVLEGALVAAWVVQADRVVVATKASFTEERAIVDAAIAEQRDVADALGVEMIVVAGPAEYLYGEETGLLEVLDGRPPFPRVAPPYRHGVDEVGSRDSNEPADIEMTDADLAPPALVDNVETLANVAGILAEGPDWFRAVGTDASPGTIVCTVTGATARAAVGEVPMGTPLREVIEALGGGARPGRRLVAAMSGAANPILVGSALDTPLSYEAMEAAGSGLGAAGFLVFDDETDFVALAAAASKFLAVESCGQCTPCKQDGLMIAHGLDRVRRSAATPHDLEVVDERVVTVADSARCSLATQHQRVVGSIRAAFPEQFDAHVHGRVGEAPVYPFAPLLDVRAGEARVDLHELDKQPDWTYDRVDSGKMPAERLAVEGGDEERVDRATLLSRTDTSRAP